MTIFQLMVTLQNSSLSARYKFFNVLANDGDKGKK